MTTPDKAEMPTETRTAGPWEVLDIQTGIDGIGRVKTYAVVDQSGRVIMDALNSDVSEIVSEHDGEPEGFFSNWDRQAKANAQFIVTACNAYEPMREALLELEAHHVEQNRLKRRGEADSKTLRIIRAALSTLPINDRQTSDDAERLREALASLEMLYARPGENSIDHFERVAEVFFKETGHPRPGKECLLKHTQTPPEAYQKWIDKKISVARAALKGVRV